MIPILQETPKAIAITVQTMIMQGHAKSQKAEAA
jgi:hypothetical protein